MQFWLMAERELKAERRADTAAKTVVPTV
ncbi:hypothetical protein [Methylobacterium sp. WL64]|nr:hypothetical protein [Methylobacterium sp. WL64]